MALPEQKQPQSLEEAVAELKRDPTHLVHIRVDGLEIELRVVDATSDVLNGGGPWKGETTEELLRILREARERDVTGTAP